MSHCMQCSFCTSCALFVGQKAGIHATRSANAIESKGCVMKWSCRRQCFPEHLRQKSGMSCPTIVHFEENGMYVPSVCWSEKGAETT